MVKGGIHSPERLEVMVWKLMAGDLHFQLRCGRWWW